jgi:UDP-2,3-diacylglucosamine pyrophosphatase LpxH
MAVKVSPGPGRQSAIALSLPAALAAQLESIGPPALPASAPYARKRHRSLFMSDMHLGASHCRSDRIVDFLTSHDAETIYLVGDIFDKGFGIGSNWTPGHDSVLRVLMGRVREGRRIVFIPGSHDDAFRRHYGVYFDQIEIAESAVHVAASGERYLVVHGDCFDVVAMNARWLATFGGHVDHALRHVNALLNRARRPFGLADWSLMDMILPRLNMLVTRGDLFGRRVKALAARHGADGVICGHFHRAEIHEKFGVPYINCGDWTDCCTALAEDFDGRMRLIDWKNPAEAAMLRKMPLGAAATAGG